ncbi:hypothetical protein [Burkholderia ubonensis]|uniref:hypothetical protein n=1 Tax=Burkholderia ubonensis TaxID=101571 RepID=UPI001177B2D5|nr:hypothetical protein [Burkholderia ubonensis]
MRHALPGSRSRQACIVACLAVTAGLSVSAGAANSATPDPSNEGVSGSPITISSKLPADIPVSGGAPKATLEQAANFAWEEFIALNWPAVPQTGAPNTRDQPDQKKFFGDPKHSGPLVWHTYRAKVEIFPGEGAPPGYLATTVTLGGPNGKRTPPAKVDYGYDHLPTYRYQVPIPPASGQAPGNPTPWINLDENSQIFLDQIYAGVAASNEAPWKNKILFMAKANRKEYAYIAAKGWWDETKVPFAATRLYILKHNADPAGGTPANLVSLPPGAVEVKAAWRRLGPSEDASRFYTTTVRYYEKGDDGGQDCVNQCYVDETMALVGLHIIQKTPSAPYFIFATFEQADNITDRDGKPVEDEVGNYLGPPGQPTLTPTITSNNAKVTVTAGGARVFTPQTFDPPGQFEKPGKQLYYLNTKDTGLVVDEQQSDPLGIVVNRRMNPIPPEIIHANTRAHQEIASYMSKNLGTSRSPWAYYKLVNVQFKPIGDKTPGVTYDGPDTATYYQSNSTIETDYNLQRFSGVFHGALTSADPIKFTISDFAVKDRANLPNKLAHMPVTNVIYDGQRINMGGCMGCHGVAQRNGAGFSFILRDGRVKKPDLANQPVTLEQVARFVKYFGNP